MAHVNMNFESTIKETYSNAAKMPVDHLCCPPSYASDLWEDLPKEIIEKDYGCGDPTPHVKEGDYVLDLGCGVGKLCFMMAKIVGSSGKVTGVDINEDMLSVAQKYVDSLNERTGVGRVNFIKTKIQDLRIDIDQIEELIKEKPIGNYNDYLAIERSIDQYKENPVVPEASYDVVVSNCVLNLVDKKERLALVEAVYRVLKPGGRLAISDIVCSEPVPSSMLRDGQLWSNCLSGAFEEEEMGRVFAKKGFIHLTYPEWSCRPWRVINGIEFRSVTLTGYKPKSLECSDCSYQVIYKGPFSELLDDANHRYPRGRRVNLCQETYDHIRRMAPESFVFIENKDDNVIAEGLRSEDNYCELGKCC